MPHSTYSRIFDVLSTIKDGRGRDIFELSESIYKAQLESFAIWRKVGGSSTTTKAYCSPSSVRRLIRFTAQLELMRVDENKRTCRVLPPGTNALKGDNYPVQLGAQLLKYMKNDLGISLAELETVIRSIKPPRVTDSETIYQSASSRRGVHASYEEFRRLLYLLQRCDRLSALVRKIYRAPSQAAP